MLSLCTSAARQRAGVSATFAIAALLTCAAPAFAFQGSWVPAADLSVGGQMAGGSQIAFTPDGTLTAIWQRGPFGSNAIQASTRPRGGSFSAPIDLSVGGQYASDPRIAVARDGTTTVIWYRSDGAGSVVQASTRPPGGGFGAPVDLSASGQNAGAPEIAVAPDGTTTAIWGRSDMTSIETVQTSTRPPGGSFGPPIDLSVAGKNAQSYPQVAVAPDGTTTAIWRSINGANGIVRASTRPPGGGFGAPVDVSADGQDAVFPRAAVGPDGTTTTVWQLNGGTQVIQASTRPPGGSFSAPIDLSAPGQPASDAHVAIGPDGTTTAIWDRSDGANLIVQASTRPPGGSFSPPIDLAPIASAPQIAVAPDGTTTALWSRSNGGNLIVQASTRPPGGSFDPPVDLSAGGHDGLVADIAVAPDGAVAATWLRLEGINSTTIQASFTDSLPAARAAPVVTGKPTRGSTLTCDGGVWTGAASVATDWLRADVVTGSGSTYRVTTADQGRQLVCRAKATNPFGSVQSLSAATAIPAAPARPRVKARPRISGTARAGRTLKCKPARFANASPRTTTQWLRAGKPVKGATRLRYKLTRRDVGKLVACRTRATGPGGTATSVSRGVRVRR